MKKFFKILGSLFSAVLLFAGLLYIGSERADAADVTVVTVTDYGANGSDTKSDRRAIQDCLNMAKEGKTVKVVIPAGKYYIDDVLIVYDNTTISLAANAEIIRMDDTKLMLANYRDQVTGGYGQSSNIVVEGGKWSGNVKNTTHLSPLMLFYHAQNITIRNTDVGSYCARHAIIFGGIKKGTVDNVKIHDFVAYTGTDPDGEYYTSDDKFESLSTMEALHLDCIAKDGQSEAGALPLDGTPCADITVSNCEFVNVPVALGNHYEGYPATGLTVNKNKFSNIKYVCIDSYSYRNVNINGNTAENVSSFAKFIDSTGTVSGNNITCKATSDKLYGIYVYTNSNVAVNSNTITNSNLDAIALYNAKSSSISNNKIYSPKDNGIAVYGTKSSVTKISGNTVQNGKIGILLSYSGADSISDNIISKPSEHGISLVNNAKAKISSNEITNPTKNGVSVNKSTATVTGNTIKDPLAVGVGLYTVSNSEVSSNTINNAGSHGVEVNGSTSCKVNGNTISLPKGQGIGIYSSKTITASSNTVDTGAKNGIYIDASSVTAQGNKISGAKEHGIIAQNGSTGTISGNTLTSPVKNGVNVNNAAVTVSSNTVSNAGNVGIMIYNSKQSGTKTVNSNTVTGSKGIGIQVNGSSNVTLKGNSVNKSGTHGIQAYQSSNVSITNNVVKTSPNHGITVNYSTSTTVTYNTVSGSGSKDVCANNDSTGSASNNAITNADMAWTYNASKFPLSKNGHEYWINYNANGGSGTMATTTVMYGVNTATSSNTFTRNGYTFTGWTAYRASDKKWYCGSNGWRTDAEINANGYKKHVYPNKSSVAKTTAVNGDKVTFYAQWKSNIKTYTVKYNANGGSGTMANQTITYGVSTATRANAFKRTGYTFSGWTAYRASDKKWHCGSAGWRTDAEIAANGYKKFVYANNAKIAETTSVNGDTVTFYAQWKKNTYTVKYNANGGSGTMANQTITYGVSTATRVNAFKRTGYTFAGWTAYRASDKKWHCGSAGWRTDAEIAANGYEKFVYANNAKIAETTSVNGDTVTFYAQWKKNTYTVKYNANGGSGAMSDQTITYGVSTATRANAFKRTGYTFAGWTAYRASDKKWHCGSAGWRTDAEIAANGYKKFVYANNAKIAETTSVNGDTVTFYAQWKNNTYTLKYNANGGSGTMSDQTITYGVSTATKANTFKRTGYTFAGWTAYRASDKKWHCGSAGWRTDAEIAAKGYKKFVYVNTGKISTTTAVNGDTVTFYAQWKNNTYTVKYNANGGSGAMSDQTITYGVSTATRANAFKRTGYTFAGWTAYRASDKKWHCGSAGWRTDAEIAANGYEKFVYANNAKIATTTSANGDTVTFYAQWRVNTYTVKYNANGGEGTMPDQTIIYGVSTTTNANAFSNEGHTFTGWTAYRESDKKWHCGSAGWRTDAEIAANGYKKLVYVNTAKIATTSAVNGDTVNFYAQWE